MARRRTTPTPTQQPAEKAEKKTEKTKTIKYTGPEGQVNHAVGQNLIPGESYDLPEELADKLVSSSAFWE